MLTLEGIDTSNWVRVGGTKAGAYYRVAEDVVVAVPLPGFQQSRDTALASLDEMRRIARERKKRQAVIILVDRVVSQDSGARRVWSEQLADEPRCAQALVCSTLLARAIGSFFIGLARSPVPTKMLPTFDDAVSWASQHVREDHAAYGASD